MEMHCVQIPDTSTNEGIRPLKKEGGALKTKKNTPQLEMRNQIKILCEPFGQGTTKNIIFTLVP